VEIKQDQIVEEQDGDLNFKPPKTSIMWRILHHNSTKTTDQVQEGVSLQEEEEEDL
jgi:hypothetical protein